MKFTKCFLLKIVALALCAVLNVIFFYKSLGVSYQWLLAQEHTRFRPEMPTQGEWINSPFGKLKTYLFNVTNSEAFLNGTDKRIKLQQVGPIVYNIVGYNDILSRNETTMTYRKHRFRHVDFLPEESVSPDILNQTIILPNMVVLGSLIVAKHYLSLTQNPLFMPFLQAKKPMMTLTRSQLLSIENLFIPNSIYYYLWEYTSKTLKTAEKVSTLSSQCGLLRNALSEKKEVYTVKIGPKSGLENFFRIISLNNNTVFTEHIDYANHLRADSNTQCPIEVYDAIDNSLYPPFLRPDTNINLVAIELCRTLSLSYMETIKYDDLSAFKYTFAEDADKPSCLEKTYDAKLPKGIFDISKCVINKAPSAVSSPHFYGSSYNWSEHFEGLNPNAENHQPYLIIEPITGIPLMEHYRFQSNMPLPILDDIHANLTKFNEMILPIFWFDMEMGELSSLVKHLINFNVKVTPILQPILMALYIVVSILSTLKIVALFKDVTIFKLLTQTFGGAYHKRLETTFLHNDAPNIRNTKAEAKF